MREELEDELYNPVEIEGTIKKFGMAKFNGYDNILRRNPETGFETAIRFTDGRNMDAIHFCSATTLIIDARKDGEKIGDGHMWIPEDLSKKSFQEDDKICIYGNIEQYAKKEGYDYCIKPISFEKIQ